MVWGIVLILAGIMLMVQRFGVRIPFLPPDYVWWGGGVTAVGLVTIITARRAETVGTGVTLSLLGLWFVVVTNELFGLHWYNSWPLALVCAGAGTVAHAIAANWLPDTKRERRRRTVRVEVDSQEAPRA
jgi:uncharacterized membrane protein HdeD (DUF308 family)